MFGATEPRLDRPSTTLLDDLRAKVDVARIRTDVERLDEPRGRLHAPEAMARAERYVTDQLEAAGWSVRRRPFDDGVAGVNLITGGGPARFLVGAHLDTVPGSPGADDNASGVAGLLELARIVPPRPDITLAVFDQEETGLHGSRALAHELAAAGREPGGVIVFECIGYTATTPASQHLPPGLGLLYRGQIKRMRAREHRGEWTIILYRATARGLAAAFGGALSQAAGRHAVMLARDPVDLPVIGRHLGRVAPLVRDFARSDHRPFWDLGMPAIQVTDTANFRNPHYHQPTDTPETLDYQRIADIVAATAAVVTG
ncbi:M20/M25/M40 family metallo-hydrolase [Phytohabitans sp. LJ34]|uniref:M20/M25/M40 family metallo-hydrolase n=1 Tax=Phytohabitans sp. LJ34 TaxID=3452217 RepID=UPI003F889823